MESQTSFAQTEYARKKKTTRRERFLAEMERLVPWARLVALIEPHYPRGERGRPPIGLERMLRVYFLQQWYGLADEALEDALYDSQALRSFVGIDLGHEPVPDATTLLKKLLRGDLKTARAYKYRINFLHFGDGENRATAAHLFQRWYRGAVRSRRKPMQKMARTRKKHLRGLLNYVDYRITNGLADWINGMIQNVERAARGFRSFGNFRVRVLFFLGHLKREPETRSSVKCP